MLQAIGEKTLNRKASVPYTTFPNTQAMNASHRVTGKRIVGCPEAGPGQRDAKKKRRRNATHTSSRGVETD